MEDKVVYEPPALVEVGVFDEDTLGGSFHAYVEDYGDWNGGWF